MRQKYKFVLLMCASLLGAVCAGFFLLVLVYLIPTDRIRQNVAAASEQVTSEGGYYQWAKGYKSAQLDTYTDASLFLNAMYPGSGNPVRDAMNAPRMLYGDDNNEESVVLLAKEEEGKVSEVNYGRYWHGSLVFLKPLLYLFDLADVRMFSMIIQLGLLFLVISGFVKRGRTEALPGLFVSLVLMNPITMAMGFCFSAEYILMLLITAFMLFYHEKLMAGYGYYFLFLWSGILFVYFNELSFPMIGLGIPLTAYLLLSGETPTQLIKKEILFSIMWGTGYVAVWIGKWILAWIFTGYNYFKEALQQAERYTSNHATWEVENPSLGDRLIKNINVYLKWPFVLTGILVLAALIIWTVMKRKQITRENVIAMLPYFWVVLMPFVIYVVLGNGYSYVHYWFTHRLLSISAFAGVCMILRLTENKKDSTK